jgi:hypothetical protein
MTDRLWLDVPFAEKDTAKAAGARWDPQVRRWYAPRRELLPALDRWVLRGPQTTITSLLPGEDRSFGQGLFVDPVPSSCWFTNVRSCVEKAQWDQLRNMVYRRAENRCEACGKPRGRDRERLECHERWSYDEATRTQSLRRLIALCWTCHRTTHFGYAQVTGTDDIARAHLAKVNGWSKAQVEAHIDAAAELWGQRSAHDWHLDLGILANAGIRVVRPPEPHQRRQVGHRAYEADEPFGMPVIDLQTRATSSPSRGARRPGPIEEVRLEARPSPQPAQPSLWTRIRQRLTGATETLPR